jgi:AraC family transcriptional regulator
VWRNQHDRTGYQQPGHHTVSVYLEGGQDTRYLGESGLGVGAHGAPGRSCVLPAEHESGWVICEPFRFLHLYLSEQAWGERVVRLLDAEPRAHTLERRIFAEDPALVRWAAQVMACDWSNPLQRLVAHAASHEALDQLVLASAPSADTCGGPAPDRWAVGTGSAAGVGLHRVTAGYPGCGTSDRWAVGLVGQSVGIFISPACSGCPMGCSVHGWITQRRVALARHLLTRTRLSLADVALACGLASASHLNTVVHKHLGVTPLQVRQSVQG